MRRISLAVLTLALVAVAAAPAEAQDALVTSARQFSQQGQHDTAISMLRGALAQQPTNVALKLELAAALDRKLNVLRAELFRMESEVRQLRGSAELNAPQVRGVVVVPPSAMVRPLGTPVRIGGGIKPPMKVRDVKPVYPPVAQSARVQGIVIAEITIDENGDVADARILRGQPLLNDAAIEAVRQWKYTPTLLNGSPVPVIMTVTVTFHIE